MGRPRDGGDGASSQGSGSQGAASSIASSTVGRKGPPGATFFTLSLPIVPFMTKLDKKFSRRLVYAGILVDFLQLLGWILNPNLHMGTILRDLGKILYASHFPLWDTSFGGLGFTAALGPFWLCVCVVWAVLVYCVSSVRKQEADLGTTFSVVRATVHSLGTWLFVPVSSWMLAFVACTDRDGETDRLWGLGHECGDALHVVHAIVAVLTVIPLWIGGFLIRTMLFDTDPRGKHFLARSHSRCDKLLILWRMGTLLTYHLLLARGLGTWFALYMAVTCLLLAACLAFVMPFYNSLANQMHTAAYLIVAWISLIVFIGSAGYSGDDFTEMQLDAAFSLGLVVPVYYIGGWLATNRISTLYKAHLENFTAGHVMTTPELIPAGLEQAGPYQPMEAIETELPDALGEDEAWRDGGHEHFLVPLLGRIWIQTDIEVATRFVAEYVRISGMKPSPQVTLAGARLFAKGVTIHKRSDLLLFQLALFLCTHNRERTGVLRFTLHHLLDGSVAKAEAALAVRYQTHVLGTWVRALIGWKDNSHIKLWRSAQKLHREALGQMGTFWARLLGAKVDTVQLAVIANGITQKRTQANNEFLSVLGVTREPQVVLSYASFLEQVMLDNDAAKLCRDLVNESDKACSGPGTQGQKDDILSRSRMNEQLSSSDSNREHLGQLTRTMNITFLILFVLVAGFFVFEMLLGRERKSVLDNAHEAGAVRTLSQQAGYLVLNMCAKEDACTLLRATSQGAGEESVIGASTAATTTEADSDEDRLELLRALGDFQAHHGALSWGKRSAKYEPLVEYNKWPSTVLHMFHDGRAYSVRGGTTGDSKLYGLWNLGYDMVERLRRISSPNKTELHRQTAYTWMIDNLGGPITEVFNRSVEFHTEKAEEEWLLGMSVLTALFLCSLVIIQIVYMVLILNFQQIEQSKLGALNLFTLIPKFELAKLHRRARALANTFDIGNTKLEEPDDDTDNSDMDELEAMLQRPDEEQEEEEEEEDPELVQIGIAVPACITWLTALCLAGLGLTLACFFLLSDEGKYNKSYRDKYELLEGMYSFQHEQRARVQAFVQDGDVRDFVAFFEAAYDNEARHVDQLMHEKDSTERIASLLADVRREEQILCDTEKTVLKIAAAAFGRTGPEVSALEHHTWTKEVTQEVARRHRQPGRPSEVHARELNSSETDLALPAADQLDLARTAIFGTRFAEEVETWTGKLQDLLDAIRVHAEDQISDHEHEYFTLLLIVVYSALCLSVVLYVAGVATQPVLMKGKVLRFSCAIFFMAAAAALGVSVKMYTDFNLLQTEVDDERLVLQRMNKTLTDLRELSDNARYYTEKGERDFYFRYWELIDTSDIRGFLQSITGSQTNPQFEDVHRDLKELHQLHTISMTLSAWGHGLTTLQWQTGRILPQIRNVHWDFSMEDDEWSLRQRFPDEVLWYSATNMDVRQPADWQVKVARATVFNDRYEELYAKCVRKIREMSRVEQRRLRDKAEDTYNEYVGLFVAGTALSALQWLCAIVYVTNMIIVVMHTRVATRGGAASNQLTESKGLVRRSQLSLILVVVCLLGMYVIGVIGLARFRDHAPRIDVASAREWSVARALGYATRFAYVPNTQEDRRLLGRRLENALLDVERYRAELYHGEDLDEGGYNGVALNSQQDSLLFGHDVQFNLPVCSTATDVTRYNSVLSRGADIALRFWIESVRIMLKTEDTQQLRTRLSELRQDATAVLYGLRQSTAQYVTTAKNDMDAWLTYFLAVLSITLAVIAVEFAFIFRPMTGRLLKQDTSTKLMLNMIPQQVRDSVPEIQEFLDSGLTAHQEGDPEKAVTEAINEMSTTPIVAIDNLGTVIKYTQAAESAFGYAQSEVVGNNVKMLMPPEFAVNHDQYIRAYQRTGVKHIIGRSRRVQAIKKNQSTFPISVLVREYRSNGESTFIGVLKDLSSELELEATMRLNQTIQAASALPMICIDNLATVSVFNNAAVEAFGFAEDEVIGQNINMLMPEKIGRLHDGYLAAYMKTGVKHVIDTTRRLQAQRKNGEVFLASVTVREIKHSSGSGSSSLFLGFLRDVTADLTTEHQHRVNDAVSHLSPIPIICMLQDGNVRVFSTAAEKVWGYTGSEVVGQNVKMLQPDDVAAKHDDYLKAYQETRKRTVIGKNLRQKAKHKNGKVFHVELVVSEVLKNGLPPTYIGFCRDVTAEYLEEVNFLINKAVANVSSVPLVTLSQEGTVTGFNPAAETEFKVKSHTIIGKNVKLLQPGHIAEQHDRYLSTYIRTGVKKIIGTTRRARARRWDGSEFPIEVTVNEVVSQVDGKRVFVGYIRNITDDLRVDRISRVNECVLDLSIVPIIAITQDGMVTRWSRAAENTWGYSLDEMLGTNVKRIMCDDVAINHDGYLEAYQRTGVKNVIDRVTKSTAKRRDGEVFPIEVSVREVIGKTGQGNTFLGFVKDLSGEVALQRARKIAAGISLASANPLVCITPFGAVEELNSAAANFFGYEISDVVGKNIKMLMPEKYAIRHDEFLANYRKTGIKNVIDTKRRVTALRSDKTELPIEISVREVLSEDLEPVYVGYLRGIESLLVIEEANKIADVVSDLSTDGLVAIDYKGTVLKWSRAAAELFEYSPQEIIGKNVKMIQPIDIASRHDQYLATYLKTEIKHVIDTLRRVNGMSKGGEPIAVELSIKEVKRQKQPPIFIGYVRDARNDNAAETERMISGTITDMSTTPIVMMKKDATVMMFNPAAKLMWGYEPEEVIGKNINKTLLPPEIARDHDSYLERYYRTGIKRVVDTTRTVQAKRKDGTLVPVEIRVKELKSTNSHFFIAYIRELTEALRLREITETNSALMESSLVPLVSIDAAGTVEVFVESACRCFGYDKSEILGKNVKILTPPEVSAHHDGYLARYASTGVKHVIGTTRRVKAMRKDRSTFPAEISVREVKKEGMAGHFVGYVRDVTDQFRIEVNNSVSEAIRTMSVLSLVVIDEIGTMLQTNPAVTKVFGWTEEELADKNIKFLQPKEVADYHDGYLAAYKKTRVKHVVGTTRQVAGQHKDGTLLPIEITVREFREEHTSTFIGYMRETSAEEQLSKAIQTNNAISDISPVPIVAITQRGIVTKYSTAAAREFGWAPDDVLDSNVKMLMPQSVAENHDGYLRTYQETGVKHVVDTVRKVTAKRKSGETFPVEITVREAASQRGLEGIFVGYIRNISSEVEMLDIQLLSTSVRDLISVPLIAIGTDCTVEIFNSAAEDLFGYTREEVVGQNVNMLQTPDIAAQHDGYIQRYLTDRVRRVIGTTRYLDGVDKSGNLIPMQLSVNEIDEEDIHMFVAYVRDVRELQKMQLNASLGDVVAGLALSPLIVIGSTGTIRKFNTAAEVCFGFEAAQVIGKDVGILMPDETAEKHKGFLQRFLASAPEQQLASTVVGAAGVKVVGETRHGEEVRALLRVRQAEDPATDETIFVGTLKVQ